MSTDYNYDEQVPGPASLENNEVLTKDQGQFFPYFILTISALVTLPLSYSLLKPDKGQSPGYPLAREEWNKTLMMN